ncbi:MAG: PorP/SprF family type IX secretion system membrane protein [Putridiphycobacter sp.]|nr:PorP/SprF family type IX secretion system membrane protein [Putridiphycobacter sp.]
MRIAFLLLQVAFTSFVMYSQDLHLSQFYTNKMNLNPAHAASYSGNYQLTANYRSQWSEVGTPINTIFLAFDKKFFFYTDEIDIGILFNDDQYTVFGQKTNKLLLNAAYTKRLGKHKIRAGIQIGAIMRSTDFSTQSFPSQWVYNTGEFETNVFNGETALAPNQSYMDASLGLLWTRKYAKLEPTVGFSLFHVNRPKDSYNAIFIERLRMRKVFFSELNWFLNSDVVIEPRLLYMWTTKTQDLVVGSNFRKKFDSKTFKSVYAGVHMRSGVGRNFDALIPTIGLSISRFDLGFSYDVNLSEISQTNSQKTSLEWSLVYTTPLYNPAKLSIPCDRY